MFIYLCEVCKAKILKSGLWYCSGCRKFVCERCVEVGRVHDYPGGELHIHCGVAALEHILVVDGFPAIQPVTVSQA